MKHKRFSDEQVIGALKEDEAGTEADSAPLAQAAGGRRRDGLSPDAHRA